jgi:hypothetical protein
LEPGHAPEVDEGQREGEEAVGCGLADDEVYVVEAVAQDGDAGGHGEADGCERPDEHAEPPPEGDRDEVIAQQYRRDPQRGGVGEPLDLQPLLAPRTVEPQDQGGDDRDDAGEHHPDADGLREGYARTGGPEAERVLGGEIP